MSEALKKFRAEPIFGDRCVLQRGKSISVFGSGENGAHVCVTLAGKTAHATVKDGRWLAVLPPMKEAEGLEMTLSCGDESITFRDIAVGEVWLAGGQSNMEFELQNCVGGKECLEHDVTPNVRYYYTPKIVLGEKNYEETMNNTGWARFGDEWTCAWSAVGYFFAKELSEKLGCTVGIIGCNWGGTRASHWMSRKSLECDRDISYDLDTYDEHCAGRSEEDLTREYREYESYNRDWEKRRDDYYANTPNPSWSECLKVCGECRYPGPPVPLNPFRATSLYDSMIKRVCPYTLAGFLYYQGESDDSTPAQYYKLLRALIALWREDWGDDELPFMIVQLPMYMAAEDTDDKRWCLIRKAQERAYRTIKNTGLAVIIDCGEFAEIHPREKRLPAHRLFEQVMYHVYGDRDERHNAALYKSHEIKEGGIEISFSPAPGAFELRGEKTGFEAAGEDGEYYPADFVLRGEKIFVFSDKVKEPLNVRYLWTNYGKVSVFTDAGIPLAPFGTDITYRM